MTLFVAFLYKENLAGGTVKSYLAAIRHSQISLGLGDPSMGRMIRLEYVVKGLKRKATQAARRVRLPITPTILGQLKRVWQKRRDRRDTSMLWAAATMCFFGFPQSRGGSDEWQPGFRPSFEPSLWRRTSRS